MKNDHSVTTRRRTTFAPQRSPIQPPGISNAVYAHEKTKNTHPICTRVRESSAWMLVAAWAITTRSVYEMSASVTAKTTTQCRA